MDAIYYTLLFPDRPLRIEFKPRFWIMIIENTYKLAKGQMKSECIFEIIDFPKYHWKRLLDFYPERLFRLGTYDMHSPE